MLLLEEEFNHSFGLDSVLVPPVIVTLAVPWGILFDFFLFCLLDF